ncbi:hypothetical protein BDZ85DRAFT_75198 [Elsinoe ampelina]|uniref:Uncharacterized protein n=1 Tax=Elsinoe ampelina TaxID=302913 RepID=A0A6A6GKN4_9PEZI|nr:hypothetical protein BDZ85DRAFT_75198 [Elsinoe ampelina]
MTLMLAIGLIDRCLSRRHLARETHFESTIQRHAPRYAPYPVPPSHRALHLCLCRVSSISLHMNGANSLLLVSALIAISAVKVTGRLALSDAVVVTGWLTLSAAVKVAPVGTRSDGDSLTVITLFVGGVRVMVVLSFVVLACMAGEGGVVVILIFFIEVMTALGGRHFGVTMSRPVVSTSGGHLTRRSEAITTSLDADAARVGVHAVADGIGDAGGGDGETRDNFGGQAVENILLPGSDLRVRVLAGFVDGGHDAIQLTVESLHVRMKQVDRADGLIRRKHMGNGDTWEIIT